MMTTIDKGGRVVVPKAMRDALGLKAGSEVEIDLDLDAGSIAIAPKRVRKHLENRHGRPVLVPDEPIPPLTDELIRQTLESIRR